MAASLSGVAVFGVANLILWIGTKYYFSASFYNFVNWLRDFSEDQVIFVGSVEVTACFIGQWIVLGHYLGAYRKTFFVWVPLSIVGAFFAFLVYGVILFPTAYKASTGHLVANVGPIIAFAGGLAGLSLGAIQIVALSLCRIPTAPLRSLPFWLLVTASGLILGDMAGRIVISPVLFVPFGMSLDIYFTSPLQFVVVLCAIAIFQGYAFARMLGSKVDTARQASRMD